MKDWITIRARTEAHFPGRCHLFEVEGSSLVGAIIPYCEEESLDFADVTGLPGA